MGLRLWREDGTLTLDTDQVNAGICLGSFVIPAGQTFYRQWPLLAGCSIMVFQSWLMEADKIYDPALGVSYPSSVPTLSLSAVSFVRDITVWCTGSPSIQNIPGQQVVSLFNTVALSPSGRGLNYVGKATKHSDAPGNVPYSNPVDPVAAPNAQIYRINCTNKPVVCMRLYSQSLVLLWGEPQQVASGVWEMRASRLMDPANPPESYKRWWSYDTELYCFAQPTSLASPPCFINDLDGTLAYDLRRGGLLGASNVVSGLLVDQPVTVSGMPTVCGVIGNPAYFSASNFETEVQGGEFEPNSDWFMSGWTRSTNQLVKRSYQHLYSRGSSLGIPDQTLDYSQAVALINLSLL